MGLVVPEKSEGRSGYLFSNPHREEWFSRKPALVPGGSDVLKLIFRGGSVFRMGVVTSTAVLKYLQISGQEGYTFGVRDMEYLSQDVKMFRGENRSPSGSLEWRGNALQYTLSNKRGHLFVVGIRTNSLRPLELEERIPEDKITRGGISRRLWISRSHSQSFSRVKFPFPSLRSGSIKEEG